MHPSRGDLHRSLKGVFASSAKKAILTGNLNVVGKPVLDAMRVHEQNREAPTTWIDYRTTTKLTLGVEDKTACHKLAMNRALEHHPRSLETHVQQKGRDTVSPSEISWASAEHKQRRPRRGFPCCYPQIDPKNMAIMMRALAKVDRAAAAYDARRWVQGSPELQ